MAAGDILSCEVLATGWQATIVVEGFKGGGTYDFGDIDADIANAKVALTVVSEGYDATGALGTTTRTVVGTRVVQQAYPNHALADETESGGNVEIVIALSDYIYDDDKDGGAGTSGTNPTVTIANGWYTDDGTGGSNDSTLLCEDLAVTNSSTQDYPTVIARWAVVPYQRFTGTCDLEAVAFHRHAHDAKPVACVTFEATDGTNAETVIATEMVQSDAPDALPCYRAVLDATDYIDNAVVTANFTAYPWVGDADSIRTSVGGTPNALTLGPLPLLADSDDDYGVTHVCVNTSTGVDSGTKAFSSLSAAQASPCATIRYALAQIQSYNNANRGRNNANAGVIYLQSNNHSINGTGTATTGDVWVTITRDPTVSKANACIIGNPNQQIATARLRLHDITLIPTGYQFQGTAGRAIWSDSVAIAAASQVSGACIWGYEVTYHTHGTSHQLGTPWASFSSSNQAALIRGCAATSANSITPSDVYAPRCLLTTSLDHSDSLSGQLWATAQNNTILAYCRDTANPVATIGTVYSYTSSGDVAIVGNLIEKSASTQVAVSLWADTNVTDSHNLLLWHNTVAGERTNLGYNEGATAVQRSLFSVKFNSFEELNTKHDVFKTDGTRTGAWSVTYGVGWIGNHDETTLFPPMYGGRERTSGAPAGYVDDKSGPSGAGGGNYTPDTGSPLVGKITRAFDLVIPWDINGTAYGVGGCAGAITLSLVASIDLPCIASTATLGAPTLTATAAIALPALGSTVAVYAPALAAGAVALALPTITSAVTLGAPTLTAGDGIALPTIPSAATLHSPTLAPGASVLTLPWLASTVVLFAPRLIDDTVPSPDPLMSGPWVRSSADMAPSHARRH